MTGVYLHLGAAPAAMRARELAQPAAVVEVLQPDVQLDRLAQAQRAETRPPAAPGHPPATHRRP